MSIRAIIKAPNPILHQYSVEFDYDNPDHLAGLRDLDDTFADHSNARGLAAVQIGHLIRAFGVLLGGHRVLMINPKVSELDTVEDTKAEECLSIPWLKVKVTRPISGLVSWTTPKGRGEHGRFSGGDFRCILHELDHLNGITLEQHRRRAA